MTKKIRHSQVTAALEVEGGYHITLCFCEADKLLGKIKTWQGSDIALVTGVEYWKKANVTVLKVDCELAFKRHGYYKHLGYGYDHEYSPHITVSRGNHVDNFNHLIGQALAITGEYFRVFSGANLKRSEKLITDLSKQRDELTDAVNYAIDRFKYCAAQDESLPCSEQETAIKHLTDVLSEVSGND